MATSREFAEYVTEQLQDAGRITCRRMFGEYGLFCGRKFFGMICDNTLFIKITEAGRAVCPGLPEQPPHEGARSYLLVEEVDDRELLARLVTATCGELLEPKEKTRHRKKQGAGKEKAQAQERAGRRRGKSSGAAGKRDWEK